MRTYLLVDLANTYFRARHSAHRASSIEEKVSFAIHVTLSSINKCWRDQHADHVVIALEGRSWRKDFYKPYKANRAESRALQTKAESEEDALFWQGLDHLKEFLIQHTNCTVLHHPELEADDLIAGWIQYHPNDEHIIVSSDTDFYQLLAANVKQYNGVSDELHTLDGIFNSKKQLVIDKKTKQAKPAPNPDWILFEKCMRGDSTDNIFSAYPGVRTNGSKNKVGLLEAFQDKTNKGFAWNNLMLQRWVDHNNVEHKVLDVYERNRTLIDLNHQPGDIKSKITDTISHNSVSKKKPMIGLQFLKFCGRHELIRLSDQAQTFSEIFSAGYSS